jgi:putative chitinase
MITPALIDAVTGDGATWYGPLRDACGLNEIDTHERVSAFLAQIAHESGGFKVLEENLNYSADRLLVVFPKYFDAHKAAACARNPERIANVVYADRMGNGDESSGDGWTFRGRGLIQLTGRHNYHRCGGALGIGLTDEPDLLTQPLYAALSAAWFWRDRGCNALADAGNFNGTTRRINGGLNGVFDRAEWHEKVKGLMA